MQSSPEQNYPRISIVMPSLNQSAFLEEAIESVTAQRYPNIELVVMDGGSTDGSVEIIQRNAARIAFWDSAPDKGQSDALNKGFGHISGEIVGWLNSDDVYTPGTFQQVASVFQDAEVRVAMSSHFGLMDAGGQVFRLKANTFTDHATLVRFWTTDGMTINQPCVFFRREVIVDQDPLFDTDLDCAMDYDLWLRITREHPIRVVPGHWANYRFHESSKSGTGFGKFYREWLAVSRRHWGKPMSATWWGHRASLAYWHGIRRPVSSLLQRVKGSANAR